MSEEKDVNVSEVIASNAQLTSQVNDLKDVLNEIRKINSEKELKIAELQATIKRYEKVFSEQKQQSSDDDGSV